MKKNLLWLSVTLTLLFASSCASTEKNNLSSPSTSVSDPNLTIAEASLRSQQVSGVKYLLAIDLTQADLFTASEEITFQWSGSKEDLRLDFFQGDVQQASLNGDIFEIKNNGQFLTIPANKLKSGINQLALNFTHPYATDGSGLTRFVDPEDKRVYMHSQFEPYYANRMFPCFDQPNIKATYRLAVKAPKEWTVISSTREDKKTVLQDGTAQWVFPETAKFSTYLFSLHAGPYKMWSDNSTAIPLRLFARQSLAKYVDVKDWFTFTKQGFAFYNKYFDFPYPFKKYDQIVAPAFNAGAMENVAAVTFAERLVPRGALTRANRRGLAGVILHEMAHMWFGDLVTMNWWNDLWLNESFATYMSQMAMVANTEFKETWMSFSGEKNWSMLEDQLVTTHPIDAKVDDVQDALANFDGITYGKGASSMKQLNYLLGAENFQKGVQNYFKTYAWKNTHREDFVSSLAQASGRDLSEWQTLWLTKANLNTIHVDFSCVNGKVEKLSVTQTAPANYPTIRPHAFELAFLQEKNHKLAVADSFHVEISAEHTDLPTVVGKACPAAVYPNFNDYAYFKISLDPKSLETFKTNLNEVNDPFLRKMLWSTLWQMVQDAQFSFKDYGTMAVSALKTEQEETILGELMGHLTGGDGVISLYFLSSMDRAPKFDTFTKSLETVVWGRFTKAKLATKKFWFQNVIAVANSKNALDRLASILDGKAKLAGFTLDEDLRWSMLRRLALYGYKGTENRMAAESKKDHSFNGKLGWIASNAALPNWDVKEKWIKEFKKDKEDYSFEELRSAFGSLFPAQQRAFRSIYEQQFFNDLLAVSKKKDSMEQSLLTYLAPFPCDTSVANPNVSFVAKNSSLDPMVLKSLRKQSDISDRCAKTVAFAKESK